MAQTPCVFANDGDVVKNTFAADQKAGYVKVVGGTAYIVPHYVDVSESTQGTVQFGGVWHVPQKAEIITQGQKVFWDADGDPVLGTAGSGAATAVPAPGDKYLGRAAPQQTNGGALSTALTATTAAHNYVTVIAAPLDHARLATATVAATGSQQNNGADVTEGFTTVTAADGTTGVVLPLAAAGKHVVLKNNGDNPLQVYPNTSDAINEGSANAAYSQPSRTVHEYFAYDATTWHTNPAIDRISTTTVAATGAAQNNGADVTEGFTTVTAADGTKAVVLPTAAAGKQVILKNSGDATLVVFPNTSDAINEGSANAAFSMASRMICEFFSYDGTTWHTDPATDRLLSATVAATGAAQNNGADVTEGFTSVTAADGTKAVVLPTAAAGKQVTLKNAGDAILKVFPNTSDAINAGAANAVFDQPARSIREFIAYDGTTWHTEQTVPRITTATVAATGAAQNNGADVTEGFTVVTGADNTKAVVLPAAAAGKRVILNNATDKTLEVFPNTSDAINAGAANAAYTQSNLSVREYIAYNGTTWYTDPETIA